MIGEERPRPVKEIFHATLLVSLQASGGPLEIRSRMDFSKTRRWGDLFLRYGRLAAGIELRDGQRSIKLVHPLEWYEGQRGVWKPQAAR